MGHNDGPPLDDAGSNGGEIARFAYGGPECDLDDCEVNDGLSILEKRLEHIFQSTQKMESLINKHGSQENAATEIQKEAQRAYSSGRLNVSRGIIKDTRLTVGGIRVDVIGGRVRNGVVELTNASRQFIK